MASIRSCRGAKPLARCVRAEERPGRPAFGAARRPPLCGGAQALALTGDERVLEIGTGSGYQAAVLSGLVASVVSVERIPQLAHEARKNLDTLQVTNVTIHEGDGTCGWPSSGPYDRILVTAGGPELPEPVLLQLKVGGALVGPFGPRDAQRLLRVVRQDQKRFSQQTLGACNFVDLIGEHGWAA